MNIMMFFSLIFFLLAIILFIFIQTDQKKARMPHGKALYNDSSPQRKPNKPLYCDELKLSGKPDVVYQIHGKYVPIEIKSRNAPSVPFASHVMQLIAYCALVESQYNHTPPYGILKYRDKDFEIPYTPARKKELENMLEIMRKDIRGGVSQRSHRDGRRCKNCGYRLICDEKLEPGPYFTANSKPE